MTIKQKLTEPISQQTLEPAASYRLTRPRKKPMIRFFVLRNNEQLYAVVVVVEVVKSKFNLIDEKNKFFISKLKT